MKRSIQYLTAIVFLSQLTTACVTLPYYYPDRSFHALAEKEGDMQVEAGVFRSDVFSGYSLSGGYAITNHSFVYGSLDFGNKSARFEDQVINIGGSDTILDRTNLDLKSSIYHWRAGYAYYHPLSEHVIAGGQISAGNGLLRYTSFDVNRNGVQNGFRELNSFNYSLGPYVSFVGKTVALSLATNVYATTFSEIVNDDKITHGTGLEYETDFRNIQTGKSYFFLNPSLQVSIGAEEYRLFANYSMSKPFKSLGWYATDNNISFGVLVNINTQKK